MATIFDRAHFDHMTASDRALQLEVLGLFRGQVATWDDGLAAGDWRAVAHTIKGSARGIGLDALAAACERAENAAMPEQALLELRGAMQDALTALDRFVEDAA
jgi:HPt (histidine-containing phosphotransfer) domain-containing protein